MVSELGESVLGDGVTVVPGDLPNPTPKRSSWGVRILITKAAMMNIRVRPERTCRIGSRPLPREV